MDKVIIGLAGEMSSGKGTIAHYLVDRYRFVQFRYSDMLRDLLGRLHLPISRENLARTSSMIRETFGQDIMSRVIAEDAKSEAVSVVVDGIRRHQDIEHLREAKNFFLVYIEVDERVRYERLVARSENAGDATKTFEEFQKEQQAEADSQVTALRNDARFIINNNGNLEELYRKIDEIVQEIK